MTNKDDFGFFLDEENEPKEEFPNLPVELQGVDCTPDKNEKLVGDFPTLCKTLYITFKEDQTKDLCNLLGLPVLDINKKNLYSFDELKEYAENGLL